MQSDARDDDPALRPKIPHAKFARCVQQQKEIRALAASLKQQALQVRKVSAQLEVSKPAPQIAVNYH
jgi:hypothetical protein